MIEIKLDMKKDETEQESAFSSSISSGSSIVMGHAYDQIGHSILPTLATGKLHFWTVGNVGYGNLTCSGKKGNLRHPSF